MITVSEALSLIEQRCEPLSGEPSSLNAIAGRILHEDIVSPEDLPPFSRSAMDGYLILAESPTSSLRLSGEIFAGDPPRLPAPGEALRVSTGCAVPEADVSVIRQEDVSVANSFVNVRTEIVRGSFIRQRASQAARGDVLLPRGARLNAGAIALLASIGKTHPLVARTVPVFHISTGREIVEASRTPGFGEIRDSNSPMIAALLADQCANLIGHARLPDDPAQVRDALNSPSATAARIILVSGGASVGDHDHTKECLLASGFDIVFAGVAMKPGKPLLVAQRGETLAFGLPGNPLSHFVCFHLFVRHALATMTGAPPPERFAAPLPPDLRSLQDPRETWWPCRSSPFDLIAWRDSSDIRHLASANALVRIPALADLTRSDNLEGILL